VDSDALMGIENIVMTFCYTTSTVWRELWRWISALATD